MAASTCEKLQYNDLCIYESKACFYLNNLRRWVQGTFYVSPEGLYYECDATQSADTGFNGISIDFNEISLVQKEASSYIFPSLVIYVDKEKYWFSSFPSRESAFNMLEHFWKENLFLSSKKLNRPRKNSIEESALGKELLKIIYDSEKVLNSSAQALQRQGAQLDNAMVAAEKLHGDLTLADSRLSTLESWVGKWSVSPAIGVLQKNIASTKTIFQYPVVYCKLDSSAKERSFQGFLRIEPDMLTVTDEHEIVVHHFKANF